MTNRFNAALNRENEERPPVWFMRQAGRYHAHYQALRKRYSFVELCKNPDAACEAALGPVLDFGFDAAILFSDLLFPLETMGMGLSYDEKHGPELSWRLKTLSNLKRLRGGGARARELALDELGFQGQAISLLRKNLPTRPEGKGLLGFVGGPLTLFVYAVEGTHKGDLSLAREGLNDGRFAGFSELLLDLLAENMALQARAGADTVAIFDTCAGEVDVETFRAVVVPVLSSLLVLFSKLCPNTPVTYYSKGTNSSYWNLLRDLPIGCLGIDWHNDLADTLTRFGSQWAIQGNVDPNWLFLDQAVLEKRLREYFGKIKALPSALRKGWITGLGHGVLPHTPEDNVRLFIKIQKEMFS